MARHLDRRRSESGDRVGLWVGLIVAFLLSSLAMVQLRCKVTGGYPCGDWPLHGYTKEFWPSFLVALAAWGLAARLRAHRTRTVWAHALHEMGRASAPMLGLVLAWVWYGLTGDAFHPAGGCTIPVLCHDVMPSAIVIWAGPWVIWGSWRVTRLLKAGAPALERCSTGSASIEGAEGAVPLRRGEEGQLVQTPEARTPSEPGPSCASASKPGSMTPSNRAADSPTGWERWLLVASMGSILVALGVFGYIGTFTRYMADDYCTSHILRSQGFLQAQRVWYVQWTGRFAFTFAVSVAELIGPRIVPVLPPLALGVWLAAILAALRVTLPAAVVGSRPTAKLASLAALILFATLNSTPNIVQSLYWQTGVLTYVAPLIALAINVAVVGHAVRRPSRRRRIALLAVLCGCISLVAGGFSDTYAVLQVGVMVLATVAWRLFGPEPERRVGLLLLRACLVGSLVSLAIVALSPGNAVRQAHFPQPANPLDAIGAGLADAAAFVKRSIRRAPGSAALSLTLPAWVALLGRRGETSPWRANLHKRMVVAGCLAAAAFLLIALGSAPAFYALSAPPPPRARIIQLFLLTCTIATLGYLGGGGLARVSWRSQRMGSWVSAGLAATVLALLILSPLAAARERLALRRMAEASALTWDRWDRDVRSAGRNPIRDAVAPAMPDVETRMGAARNELHLEGDPGSWKNICAAQYYGVRSVRAE